ncbi:hypothetical protein Plec18167_008462 [Paecilomyces lecythidis]|uniref:Heme haloperoxidase family profile domain-containing protein n=1 Tax=Paecilomyces lecythidis TaxID=3004212 RepID=A0ABR3WWD6_9EURO
MKISDSFLSLTLLGAGASVVGAMPTAENMAKLMSGSSSGLAAAKRCPYADLQAQVKEKLDKRFLVNSLSDPVDLTGDHEFQPPNYAAGDQRGPCPGLNALANHGYIPRNGVVSFVDVVPAINKVYGMGVDLASVLGIMGTVWTGDVVSLDPSFSIGGKTPLVSNLLDNLGGVLGEPLGLNGSHNFIEADSSNTRDDTYVTGNNYRLNMDKFMEWYEMAEDGIFSSEVMAQRAKNRFDESIKTNPNFYYGPVTGTIARNAGYIFPLRLFANHTQEHPEGVLTKEIVRDFFAIYGEEGNFTYKEGWERIPENWYKSPVDYGLVQLNVDLLAFIAQFPELASIGGNTGTVNSYAGIHMGDITGGVLNATTLLQGNNLLCLVMEVLKFASPNSLSTLYTTLAGPLKALENVIMTPLLDLNCPAFKDLTVGGHELVPALLGQFPGAKMANAAF